MRLPFTKQALTIYRFRPLMEINKFNTVTTKFELQQIINKFPSPLGDYLI